MQGELAHVGLIYAHRCMNQVAAVAAAAPCEVVKRLWKSQLQLHGKPTVKANNLLMAINASFYTLCSLIQGSL